MALTDGMITVNEALEYIRLNGQEIGEVYLRILLGAGQIPSMKIKGHRLIDRNDLAKWIKKRASKNL